MKGVEVEGYAVVSGAVGGTPLTLFTCLSCLLSILAIALVMSSGDNLCTFNKCRGSFENTLQHIRHLLQVVIVVAGMLEEAERSLPEGDDGLRWWPWMLIWPSCTSCL